MMLATNKEIRSKEDVVNVAKAYSNQCFNFYITLCMAFLAHISMKSETNALKVSIIQKADPVKEKVYFYQSQIPVGLIKVPLLKN